MAPIRHLSFDVWQTLIKPNPEFGRARTRFLVAELSLPAETVEAAYRKIKDSADRAAEERGVGMRSHEVYDAFLKELGRTSADWYTLRAGLERLFRKHPPTVRPTMIHWLRGAQARGYGLSIASNTNFIRGEALHDIVLGTWGVAWDFQVFSDQIGCSKPHDHFWNVVKERARAHTGAEPNQILHIGDNLICDGGCRQHGIGFAPVAGPDDVPHLLENLNAAQAA